MSKRCAVLLRRFGSDGNVQLIYCGINMVKRSKIVATKSETSQRRLARDENIVITTASTSIMSWTGFHFLFRSMSRRSCRTPACRRHAAWGMLIQLMREIVSSLLMIAQLSPKRESLDRQSA
jgi:hypothetical protein